jgi:type IV pilus assembly protein PilA
MGRTQRHCRRCGFTLIELMVTLSVATILMLIALPSFIDKTVRDQVAEALPLGELAKPAVQAAWSAATPVPVDNAAAGLPAPEKIVNERVQSVTVENGAIHIAFGNRAHATLRGKVLTLRPAGVDDARVVPLAWLCGHAPAPDKMIALGQDRTTVPAGMLPGRCR